MKKKISIFFCLTAIFILKIQFCSFAQSSELQNFSNKLFFNVFTNSPDSNLCEFIKKHLSINYCSPKLSADTVQGWSIKDTNYKLLPHPIVSVHSLFFSKHPYLTEKFQVGKIEFNISEVVKERIEIDKISLYLYFQDKKNAIIVYNNLIDSLSKISTKKKFIIINETEISEFENKSSVNKVMSNVKLILTKENFTSHNKYFIIFTSNDNSL